MRPSNPLVVLSYAVRFSVVLKYLGDLAVVLAGLTVVPLGVALYFSEMELAWRLALALVGLLLIGLPLARVKAADRIQPNEALAVTAFAYVLGVLAMGYPMMGAGLSGADALFEAVSGITTTGLSTLARVESMPRSLLFLRAWMQWYGGLGIVVLSAALLVGQDIAARRLVGPVSAGEKLETTTRIHARRMLAVYLLLTLLGTACLWLLGMHGLDAVQHVLAAVSTGGFSPDDRSLAALDGWTLRSAVIAVALLGAVSLPLYFHAYRGGWRQLAHDEELHVFVLASVLTIVLLYLAQFGVTVPDVETLGQAALMGASAQTTAGFATMPAADLVPGAKALLILSMALGGTVGSTAGGIKIARLILLVGLLQLTLRRLSMPSHAVAELRLAGHRVGSEELMSALLLVLLFALTVVASWLPFVALGYDPLDALFEVVSAVATVGLSAGITSAQLAPWLKGVLCFDMLLGRLEFIALLVLFYPPTWIGRRSGSS